jgi:hypothetical protein
MFRCLRMARADRYPLNNLSPTLTGGSGSGPHPMTAFSRGDGQGQPPGTRPGDQGGQVKG